MIALSIAIMSWVSIIILVQAAFDMLKEKGE